jgi:hypothetical protein
MDRFANCSQGVPQRLKIVERLEGRNSRATPVSLCVPSHELAHLIELKNSESLRIHGRINLNTGKN